MLHEMGIETGIDLERLLACARDVRAVLGRPLGSHTLVAGPGRLALTPPNGIGCYPSSSDGSRRMTEHFVTSWAQNLHARRHGPDGE